MIYFTSDLHFGHSKNFLYEPRGFKGIEDHDETIINNWNNLIQNDDIVFILGDIMLNDNIYGINCFNQLNGQKKIIFGNHDTLNRISLYENCPNTVVLGFADRMKYKKWHFYLSHYPTLCDNFDDEINFWTRVINLCGHRHTKNKFIDMDKGLIYHVELDAHNMMPVSIDDIIEDIKNYKKEKINEIC